MLISDFIDEVIKCGVQGAENDYGKRDSARNKAKLEGSIEGFNSCKGKTPEQILLLFKEEKTKTEDMQLKLHATNVSDQNASTKMNEYWKQRCKELEIEWVLNCLSAALVSNRQKPLIPPTARGMMQAARILGVAINGKGEIISAH